jgi:hypothetical protein
MIQSLTYMRRLAAVPPPTGGKESQRGGVCFQFEDPFLSRVHLNGKLVSGPN